jgi:predicted nucleic acid-binding protein
MIVSDAGPIVVFARIGRLSLLRDVTGILLIPDAVHSEIFVNKGAMPGASEVAQATWIQRVLVADRSTIDWMPNVLHEGEREAIALAKERGAQLLVDEIRVRREASARGVEVIGTLRILDEAKRSGHIALARPIVVQMQSQGYRFDRALILRFLEIVGED